MRKLLIGAAMLASAASASAEPVWSNIEFGMARSAVEALHPAGGKTKYNREGSIEISDVNIAPKCDAEVNIYFAGGFVDKLIINGNPSMGGRCSDTILTALASKYGEPLSRESTEGSILAREGKVYVWNRPGGVTMRFKRFSNGAFGGGGLMKASWELTYTKVVADIAL